MFNKEPLSDNKCLTRVLLWGILWSHRALHSSMVDSPKIGHTAMPYFGGRSVADGWISHDQLIENALICHDMHLLLKDAPRSRWSPAVVDTNRCVPWYHRQSLLALGEKNCHRPVGASIASCHRRAIDAWCGKNDRGFVPTDGCRCIENRAIRAINLWIPAVLCKWPTSMCVWTCSNAQISRQREST